jgi:hypothetical protein
MSTAVVTGFQKLGMLSIPLVIAVVVLVNLFGGERAIRAVGVAIGVVLVLALILNNAVALGNWIAAPTAAAAAGH